VGFRGGKGKKVTSQEKKDSGPFRNYPEALERYKAFGDLKNLTSGGGGNQLIIR